MEVQVSENYSRLKGASWFPKMLDRQVLVVGAGGIASWLSLLLSRAGAELIIYDGDVIEEHNLSGQLYSTNDIGSFKVQALNRIIMDFCNKSPEYFEEMYNEYSPSNEIVVTGLDNMVARKVVFDNWIKFLQENSDKADESILIDGRLNAETLQIFCIKGNDLLSQEKYRKEALFSDSEVEEQDCTFKQTSHCAAMIASHMVGFLTNFLGESFREVPYFYSYKIPINFTSDEC